MSKVTLESVAAEFRSGNSVPVERATLTRERMQEALEAYADARVRVALEEAYQSARTVEEKLLADHLQHVSGPAAANYVANRIRALIPPLPGPVEPTT